MILPFPQQFPADSVETQISDAHVARTLVQQQHPSLLVLLQSRRARFAPLIEMASSDLLARAEGAILIAFSRLALRHGSWGSDFHQYHNEHHVMEILAERTERLIDAVGLSAFSLREWLMLALFATCHDLHQRKPPLIFHGVGSNERASIEETFRILLQCGFDRTRDADFFRTLELMIAGTTFNPLPILRDTDTELETSLTHVGGALARELDRVLDKQAPNWKKEPAMTRALELAHVAADLDTANVSEAFSVFAKRSEDLCREREMRSQRSLDTAASIPHVLLFLTDHQVRFFFELHRFNSSPGRTAFAAGKAANEPKLRALVKELHKIQTDCNLLSNGEDVLKRHNQMVAEIEQQDIVR